MNKLFVITTTAWISKRQDERSHSNHRSFVVLAENPDQALQIFYADAVNGISFRWPRAKAYFAEAVVPPRILVHELPPGMVLSTNYAAFQHQPVKTYTHDEANALVGHNPEED